MLYGEVGDAILNMAGLDTMEFLEITDMHVDKDYSRSEDT